MVVAWISESQEPAKHRLPPTPVRPPQMELEYSIRNEWHKWQSNKYQFHCRLTKLLSQYSDRLSAASGRTIRWNAKCEMMIHVRGERVAYDVHLCVHVFIIPWKRDVLACALVIVNCAGIFAQGLSFNEIHASEYIAVNIMHACARATVCWGWFELVVVVVDVQTIASSEWVSCTCRAIYDKCVGCYLICVYLSCVICVCQADLVVANGILIQLLGSNSGARFGRIIPVR